MMLGISGTSYNQCNPTTTSLNFGRYGYIAAWIPLGKEIPGVNRRIGRSRVGGKVRSKRRPPFSVQRGTGANSTTRFIYTTSDRQHRLALKAINALKGRVLPETVDIRSDSFLGSLSTFLRAFEQRKLIDFKEGKLK